MELINGILDLSRIEADKLVLDKSLCPLRQIIDDALSAVRIQAEEKGLILEVGYSYPLPEKIETDAIRLHQILVNLLGNAVKFTQRGAIHIGVRCLGEGDRNLCMQFAVRDTGIGIAAEKLGELFQPFMQVDGSTTRRFGGTGLGLAISKRLAKALGGDIDVASEVGEGSTFTLTVDGGPVQDSLIQAAPEAAVDLDNTGDDLSATRMRGRILLAEDISDVQLAMGTALRQLHLEVDIVANGHLACEAAEQSKQEGRPYDVILMDMQMPGMNGHEATKWLRANGWQRAIVAVTADAMMGDREKCLGAGCDDYLSKPIDFGQLREVLQRFLPSGDDAERVGGNAMSDGIRSNDFLGICPQIGPECHEQSHSIC